MNLLERPRRLRHNAILRTLVSETQLSLNDLIYPLFIKHGITQRVPIKSMPGIEQLPLSALDAEIREIQSLGIKAVILFGIPETKDAIGSDACSSQGIIASAIKTIKNIAPDLFVIADCCFCEYTDTGHCEIINNDNTLKFLAQQAITQAQAGADMIAPSGMQDGMVAAIRHGLDEAGFRDMPIMSYSVKYASSFYGPFREASEGTPKFGDRKSYQMDPANSREAIKENQLDINQGADILMIKPALPYLDIIHQTKQIYPAYPLAAYQVSGEYSMLMAAIQNNWLNEKTAIMESLIAIKRAGADLIITYFAKKVAGWLKGNN